MVANPRFSTQGAEDLDSHGSNLKWTKVTLQEVLQNDYRLEASVYGSKGRQVRKDLEQCKWKLIQLDTFIEDAFYGSRSKRIYVDKGNRDAVGFLGSSEMLSVQPKPVKFLLKADGADRFTLKKGQVLLSRSGTIGNVSYVNAALANYFVSEHAIRINCREFPGYVYTFLKSEKGKTLVQSNIYGAVISQVEPEHLNNIPIPNPPSMLKQEIHCLVEESFKLRDESNDLIDEAQTLLHEALRVPAIEELQAETEQFDKMAGVLNYFVPLSKLSNRLDGSYHVPIVQVINQHLEKMAKEVVQVGDSRISQSVILPGRFKRVYVEEGNGVVFLDGKQIYELNPSNKKYLAISQHGNRINQLTLRENMTLITRSGTIGKVTIVPAHWEGWTANEHVIRVVPATDEIAGYLCAWLSSDHAYPLIDRNTYGAVVDEINAEQVSKVVVPLLRDEDTQRVINSKVLEANRKRTEAYELEQEALTVLDEKVIYAR